MRPIYLARLGKTRPVLLGTFVGFFLNDQEAELSAAINHAFDPR